jgi:hypothetical protein
MSIKIAMKQSEIKPATFRLVAQCINQQHHQQRAPMNIITEIIARRIRRAAYGNKIDKQTGRQRFWLEHHEKSGNPVHIYYLK